MGRKVVGALLGLLWAFFCIGNADGRESEGGNADDNVILVIADDIGVEKIAKYGVGSNAAPTPNIDRLMENGIYFTNAYSNPLCSATRATMITGRYGFRTGVGFAIGFPPLEAALPFDEITIPEIISAKNAIIGKWHLHNMSNGNVDSPMLAGGFDFHSGLLAGRVNDYFNWTKTVNGQQFASTNYITTDIADDAVAWLKANQENQFFLWLAFNAPHEPYQKPPDWMHSFNSLDPDFILGVKPDQQPEGDPVPFFNAMVEAMDTEIGRVLASLPPDVRSRTTIIVVGDNGTPQEVATPPFTSKNVKATLGEGGIHVPMIISGPRVAQPGRSVEALVNTVDVFSTVLELMGYNASNAVGERRRIDSVSMVPYMTDARSLPLRSFAYAEQFEDLSKEILLHLPPFFPNVFPILKDEIPEIVESLLSGQFSEDQFDDFRAAFRKLIFGRVIRNDRYKLIVFANEALEFYDLLEDPFENNDLMKSDALSVDEASNLKQLMDTLRELLES